MDVLPTSCDVLQLIVRANTWAQAMGMQGQVLFELANATISLQSLLASYPGPLTLATIQVRLHTYRPQGLKIERQ